MWGSTHCDLINTINSTCVFYHLTYGHRLRQEQQDGSVGQGMAPETDELHARTHTVEKRTNLQHFSSDLNHGTCVPPIIKYDLAFYRFYLYYITFVCL